MSMRRTMGVRTAPAAPERPLLKLTQELQKDARLWQSTSEGIPHIIENLGVLSLSAPISNGTRQSLVKLVNDGGFVTQLHQVGLLMLQEMKSVPYSVHLPKRVVFSQAVWVHLGKLWGAANLDASMWENFVKDAGDATSAATLAQVAAGAALDEGQSAYPTSTASLLRRQMNRMAAAGRSQTALRAPLPTGQYLDDDDRTEMAQLIGGFFTIVLGLLWTVAMVAAETQAENALAARPVDGYTPLLVAAHVQQWW